MGSSAGADITTGSYNIMMGANAGRLTTTSADNIILGTYSGYCLNSGGCNIFIGQQASRLVSAGNFNIVMGRAAACCAGGNYPSTYYHCNIVLGYCAGLKVSSRNNIFIGSCAGASHSGEYYGCNISIGNRDFFNSNPFNGATASNTVVIDSGTGNAACFVGSFSAWGNTSDCRDKKNVQNINVGRCFLSQLRPVKFEWNFRDDRKDTDTQGKVDAGFLAQEVDKIITEHNAEYLNILEKQNENELGMYTTKLIPVIVKAFQEINEENENLKNELDLLKFELNSIKQHLGL
jgi:hypothetical protein